MQLHELNTQALGRLTEEEFRQLSSDNPHLRMERNARGNIEIMAPTSSETGFWNLNVATELALWNRQTKRGYAFDSSTGFTLPNAAIRSPDASLILKEHWEALPLEERKKFARICPDFVVEIVSASDELAQTKAKMTEWIAQGSALGWLIDFNNQQVIVYTKNRERDHPFQSLLAGEGPVAGFVIDLPRMMEV